MVKEFVISKTKLRKDDQESLVLSLVLILFYASAALIQKPVNWFAMQIFKTVSLSNDINNLIITSLLIKIWKKPFGAGS